MTTDDLGGGIHADYEKLGECGSALGAGKVVEEVIKRAEAIDKLTVTYVHRETVFVGERDMLARAVPGGVSIEVVEIGVVAWPEGAMWGESAALKTVDCRHGITP